MQFALLPGYFLKGRYTIWFDLIGLILVLLWVISTYFYFSAKKISSLSNVLLKIKLKNKFFSFFVTPTLLYVAVSMYSYYTQNLVLKQVIICISFAIFLILFVHIRSAYQKVFWLEKSTKSIFLFVDFLLFYLSSTGITLMGISAIYKVLGVTFLAMIFLINMLIVNKQYSFKAFLVLLISVLSLFITGMYFIKFGYLTFPLFMIVIFYMIVSIWGIKLSGEKVLSEYTPPVLFSLMAIMVLLSL